MKITILQGAFLPVPPIQGGAVEKIWHRMGLEFAKLEHEVTHISKKVDNLPSEEKVDKVRYIRVKGYRTPSSLLKLKLFDLFYTLTAIHHIPEDAEIIVTNTFWAPIFLRGKKGRKVYVSVERTPKGQMKFYKHVGVYRACSPSIDEAVKKELPATVHRKVSFVPNPIPFNVTDVNSKKENTILFVGRLHPEKGVDVLIKAFKKLNNDWLLEIVGPHKEEDGGGGEAYLSQLKSLAGDANIRFVGPVFKHEQLVQHFATASIFCYPAQDGSGDAAPVAPREAMAYGAVPVVSQLPCFSDFITSGKNGLTYNQSSPEQVSLLAEALLQLINDEPLRQRLSSNCKNIIEEYAPGVIAKRFLNDFEKLASR